VKKKISGEGYDINKQTIYIAPKSKIELRVHCAMEPARGIVKTDRNHRMSRHAHAACKPKNTRFPLFSTLLC